jgi:arylsulfatase A-like enzyme
MPRKPNILYFVADQMRADAQRYLGNRAAITPNLDRLAKKGVAFRNAYCQNPVCVPSRCSFLSGLYPHTTGHRTMHFLQNEDEPNILRTMKESGYEVVWIGRNDVVPGTRPKTAYCNEYYDGIDPNNQRDACIDAMAAAAQGHGASGDARASWDPDSYSFYLGETRPGTYGRADEGCVEAALAYLDRYAAGNGEKPFFVYCSLAFPHPPYGCDRPWYGSTDRNALPPRIPRREDSPAMIAETVRKMDLDPRWPEERWNELRATYLDMVSKFDSQLGQVLGKLQETGLYDDTSVFVFSDHGDYTGDYGLVEKVQNCFEDALTNVPLVIKPAAGIACRPRVTPALVELNDLCATLADMCDIDLGYVQYGASLMGVIAGDDVGKDAVFSEGGRGLGDRPSMELGHDDPHDVYWPRISTQQEEGPNHTRATMIRMGNLKYTMRLYERDTLYDLDLDPHEQVNRIDDPAYAERVAAMRDRLLAWYQETADWVPNRKDLR